MATATAIPFNRDANSAFFEPTISCTQSRNVNHYTMTPIKRHDVDIFLAIKRPRVLLVLSAVHISLGGERFVQKYLNNVEKRDFLAFLEMGILEERGVIERLGHHTLQGLEGKWNIF